MISSVTCPRAHAVGWEADARFCPECGDPLLVCPEGHPVEGASRFCPTCGTALQPVGTEAAPPTEPAVPVVPAVPAGTSREASPGEATSGVPSSDRSDRLGPAPHRRWPRVLAVTAIVLLVGGGAFAAVRLLHPSSSRHAAETASTVPPAPHGAPGRTRSSVPPSSSTTTIDAAAQEARSLSPLLARSAHDFTEVQQATSDLANGCSNLQEDQQLLSAAAQDRRTLVTEVQSLDLSALPAGPTMQQDLSEAWSASAASDTSYAQAAADAMTEGCDAISQDPAYRAPTDSGSDRQSTNAKEAFVGLWNPIAGRYGQPQYQPNQF